MEQIKLDNDFSGFHYDFSTKEELQLIISGLAKNGFIVLAEAIRRKHQDYLNDQPEEKSIQVDLTQNQVNLLHVLLGHVTGKDAMQLLGKIEEHVSDNVFENFDLLSFEISSSGDGVDLNLSVNV